MNQLPEQQPAPTASHHNDKTERIAQDHRKGAFISNGTFHDVVIGVQNIFTRSVPQFDPANRRRMLEQVKKSWIAGVLDQSLYHAVLINLNLHTDPQAVGFSGPRLAARRERETQPLPGDATIAQVFQQANQRLLILSAPGGGKTTLLLELTRLLLEQAAYDEARPIPVIFNLSSWAQQRLPLERWLVQELRDQYGVAQRIGRQWLADNRVLPLLDGLDEVATPQRAACVTAINRFIQEHGGEGLAVCSRSDDYEAIGSKLLLDEAVQIQPLDDDQIECFLDLGSTQLAGVRAVVYQDAELRNLARAPLMLNILALAYQDQHPDELLGLHAVAQRQHLFEHYVERMFDRPARNDPKRYTRQQTLRWLRWLAKRLAQDNQTMFKVELMQPWWLHRWWQRGLYGLLATLGVTSGTGIAGFLLGVPCGILTFLAILMVIVFYPNVLPDDLRGTMGLLSTAIFPPVLGVISGTGSGLGIGLSVILFQNQKSSQNIWHICFGSLLTFGLTFILWLLFMSTNDIVTPIILAAMLSSIASAIATGLMIRQGKIRPTEMLRWSRDSVRKRWYIVVIIGMTSGIIGILIGTMAGNIILGILVGSATGVAFGLFGALISGITQVELQTKMQPNQGVWRSLKHALIVWFMTQMLFGVLFGVAFGLIIGVDSGVTSGPIFGVLAALLVGFPWGFGMFGVSFGQGCGPAAGLYFGGLTFVQHFALRLVCALCDHAPWRYLSFLDYASERLLLRQVGGSYIFIHRLFLEHFAQNE